ncbi:MAG: hypothetical protein M0Q91_05320 [Methanoregula sp.]|nr:hypothetical protein [Methanoregula sp.]
MKRILIILIAILFLVASASANTALNFQQPADFTAQVDCTDNPVGCKPQRELTQKRWKR